MHLMMTAREVWIMTSWRWIAVTVLAAFFMAAASQAAENNDKPAAAAGESNVGLYETDQFSFRHPAAVTVKVMEFDPALTRYDGGTAKGTHIIVERHQEVGDEDLIAVRDIFLNNMLAGPITDGARIARKDVSRKLHDGAEVKGVRAMAANADNELVIAVYTLRVGKGALMFATLLNKTAAPDEGVIIDQFWDTLQVKN
jgi:hypothetical protein